MKKLAAAVILGLMLVALIWTRSSRDHQSVAGEALVIKIEDFRRVNARLPKDVTELGMVEALEGPAFYQKEPNGEYIVWYGSALGESVTYDSKEKQWSQ